MLAQDHKVIGIAYHWNSPNYSFNISQLLLSQDNKGMKPLGHIVCETNERKNLCFAEIFLKGLQYLLPLCPLYTHKHKNVLKPESNAEIDNGKICFNLW